MKQCALDAFHS